MKTKLFKTGDEFCHIDILDFKGGVFEEYKVDGLKNGDKIVGYIDYPLAPDKAQKFQFTWKENRFDLCRQICEAYHSIYEEKEKYGVWGHDIGDLVIEQLQIDTEKKTVELFIGS